ncbi:MAG: ATP-dependent DNA helicase RecG [Clostridia bacterium]|nr:ATP-dependent DNA helicase RecG [Clostridia bacterium]
MTSELDKNVQYLKGIGEKKAALFAKLKVFTVGDLLAFYPRDYERWDRVYPIGEAPLDTDVCVAASLISPFTVRKTRAGLLVFSTVAADGDHFLALTFFNNKYVKDALKDGEEYLFYGKIRLNADGNREMVAPAYARVSEGGYLHPVYPQTEGLNSKAIAKAVRTAIDLYGGCLKETLPDEQIRKYRLLPSAQAVEQIHFPKNEEEIHAARRRLIYEELLTLQLGILTAGGGERVSTRFALTRDRSAAFAETLPFRLTNAQQRAIRECMADMQSGKAMRRLLQGDVGSGKTAVAAALIDSCAASGFQSALMAPTEVLAQQHYRTFREFFKDTGLRIELLTGSVTPKNKRLIKERAAQGDVDLLIGTHAVITGDVQFQNLALAVTDEQHRFGVTQRAKLREKGDSPHVLVMSATPIPRTLSLIIYGDLDISVLDEKPAGRRDIRTYTVPTVYHERLYAFIRKEVAEGRQCYIVCPAVEESKDTESERTAAEDYAKLLSGTVFRDLRTDILHGKMRPKQKEEAMRRFQKGETDVLICTVVIEVGVDVPNATVMVIENAEFFGLSQLHQLRGRVGRGAAQSYCVLVSDATNEKAAQRLSVMCETNDGFKIAEEDLNQRGPGDFFGNRQSGLPLLKLADLMTDGKILYAARDEAQRILADDPALALPKNVLLKEKVSALFADIS